MRITKQAQEAICEIIKEKANAKIDELLKESRRIRGKDGDTFERRLEAFREEFGKAFEALNDTGRKLLEKHGLKLRNEAWKPSHVTNSSGIDPVSSLENELDTVVSKKDEGRIAKINEEIDAINAKRKTTEREVILRASLNGDYDEIMKLVNGIVF